MTYTLTTAGKFVVGCIAFGSAWMLGTAIGWGILHDFTLTMFMVGIAPIFVAAVGFYGTFVGDIELVREDRA